MAKLVKPLTNVQIKSIKATEKLAKLSDGGGLALWVYPNGLKKWRFSFKDMTGKQQTATLGHYPAYSLVEAREWRDQLRTCLDRGEDPFDTKQDDDALAPFLFKNVVTAWYLRWVPTVSEKYGQQVLRMIERYILPKIGDSDIRKLETYDLVGAMRVMEERGISESLRRTKNSLGLVFDYAVASGMVKFNPIKQIGTQVFMPAEKENFAALAPADLPLLIDFLEQRGRFTPPPGSRRLSLLPTTRLSIYWLLLTMTRVQEGVKAKHSEIDLENRVWHIEAMRKKERRDHVVYLSDALLHFYSEIQSVSVAGEYLFEGVNAKKHVSLETPCKAMRDAGLGTTAHGLRSLARTYLREVGKFDWDVGEKLLAHKVGNTTEAAYNRSELWDERKEALEWWGNEIMNLVRAG